MNDPARAGALFRNCRLKALGDAHGAKGFGFNWCVQVGVENTFVLVCIQWPVGFIPRRVGDMLVPRRSMATRAFHVRLRFVASAPSTVRGSTFSI
jgi:hypothetical protein